MDRSQSEVDATLPLGPLLQKGETSISWASGSVFHHISSSLGSIQMQYFEQAVDATL